MRISASLAAALVSMLWVNEGSAACAPFVCKNPTCRYQVQSSRGMQIVAGLGTDATYCDFWRSCVTPRRPVKGLGAC